MGLSLQDIRDASGLQKRVNNGSLVGNLDGQNKTFYLERGNIVEDDHSDEPSIASVNVRVNDKPASIARLDAKTGLVVLANAPAASSKISASYFYSGFSKDRLEVYRQGAISSVFRRVQHLDYTRDTAQKEFDLKGLMIVHAVGYIFINEQGISTRNRSDTIEDGQSKIEFVDKQLDKFIATRQETASGEEPESVVVSQELVEPITEAELGQIGGN